MADPKFVADNFSKSAVGVAQNVLSNIASEAAAEIKAAVIKGKYKHRIQLCWCKRSIFRR